MIRDRCRGCAGRRQEAGTECAKGFVSGTNMSADKAMRDSKVGFDDV